MKSVYLIILIASVTYVSAMPSKPFSVTPDGMDNAYVISDLALWNSFSSRLKHAKISCCPKNNFFLLGVSKDLLDKQIETLEKNGITSILVNTNSNGNAAATFSPSKRNLDSIGGGNLIKRTAE